MSIFKDVLGAIGDITGISSVGDAAGSILKAIKGSPEFEKRVQEIEFEKVKLEFAENASVRELLKAEVASEDKFVRRARPAMLWLCFGILAMNFGLIPLINAITIIFGGDQIVMNYPQLPENVYWTISSIFGLYAGARSWDKYSKSKNGNSK